jgi:hypothetical protein
MVSHHAVDQTLTMFRWFRCKSLLVRHAAYAGPREAH